MLMHIQARATLCAGEDVRDADRAHRQDGMKRREVAAIERRRWTEGRAEIGR